MVTELTRFQGHMGSVLSVAFSPDGKVVASAAGYRIFRADDKAPDRTIRIWPIRSLDELLVQACDRLHDYLTTNPTVSDEDRKVCDGIGDE
ncbi:MAG: hypothetical protein ACO331_11260 [Prochlorothrix sp.]